ncbi:MAG: LPXTG cell wall anchor domain-containing protein, partial [Oscillospiraceae bacterium]|nr:LPXTG cell wall anchor domain-containing protein [Oscillospiraceae bacterium]
EFDGETFIEFDKAEVYPEGAVGSEDADGDGVKDSIAGQPIATCVNQTVLADAITYGSVSTSGLHSSIDKTKLNYMAIRVKIEDPNNKTSGFYLYMNGRQTLTTLETAYTIDKATGAINTPDSWKKWNSKDFIFEGAFDGWVVVPLDVYGKDNITNGNKDGGLSILPYLHNGAGAASPCHDSKAHTLDGWDDKTLYIGDIVVFENENQFKSVHVCGAAGHVKDAGIRTEATCTADAYTTYNCSACKSVVTEVEEGTALNHKNKTTVEVPVTCYQDGYKKVTCPDCNTTLVDEKYTNRPQHTPSGAPVPKDPTCYADGSTGDIVCTVCAAAGYEYIFVAGTPITTRPDHTPSAERVGVVEATCTKEGYTGDIICTVCDAAKIKTVLNQGEETNKLSHVEAAELKNKVDATCSKKGYSGDVVCKDCGTTMVEGKETDMLKHEAAAERVDVEEAKCGVAGYTGDVVCKVCGYTMEEGEEVKALEHKAAADLKDKKEPTATDKGYTGDKVCELCGTVMETGKEIAATGTTTGGATTPDDDKTEGDTTTGGGATTPDDDKTEGDATTGGDNTDGENAGAGSEDDGDIAPETGDNASILLAVVMALMAGAVVVLAKKRALNK